MKQHFEIYLMMMINFLKSLLQQETGDLSSNSDYPKKLFFFVLPWIKLSLILIMLFLIWVFINSLRLSNKFTKHNEEMQEITKPYIHSTGTSEHLKLKGRCKKTPRPINYNEIFSNSLSKEGKNEENLTLNNKLQKPFESIQEKEEFEMQPNQDQQLDLLVFDKEDDNLLYDIENVEDKVNEQKMTKSNLDPRSELINRLLSNNYMQATAIANLNK